VNWGVRGPRVWLSGSLNALEWLASRVTALIKNVGLEVGRKSKVGWVYKAHQAMQVVSEF
jgi:hypothetical protein